MSGQQEARLPLTAGFGATRETLWKAFGDEEAVRAAWALTLLSEYRLLQLSRRSVRFEPVRLEKVPVEDKSVVGHEFLKNLLPQYAYSSWEHYTIESIYEKRRKETGDWRLDDYFKNMLRPIMSGILTMDYLMNCLLKGEAPPEGDEDAKLLGFELKDFPRDRADEIKSMMLSITKMFSPYITIDPKSITVQFPPPERNFSRLVEVADILDKYVGPRTRMYEIARYRKTPAGELRAPSYADVEREAEELLRRLAPLGAKVEYVLSSLAVNGYKVGVTEQMEIPAEEKERLERLLDRPFWRVALIIAYGRVCNLRSLLQKLNREAFTSGTGVPKAYVKSRPSARVLLG